MNLVGIGKCHNNGCYLHNELLFNIKLTPDQYFNRPPFPISCRTFFSLAFNFELKNSKL